METNCKLLAGKPGSTSPISSHISRWEKNVREQANIDKLMVETLEGTKNEWGWSKAKLGANTPLAISMTDCRAGAAVELADKRTDKFVMPVFSLNVINDENRAINRLACLEFISVPTGASSLAEAMITVTEVHHTLKFGHQEDGRRDACNVADMTGSPPSAQDSNEPLCLITDSLELDQCLAAFRMESRLMNAECPLIITMPKNVQPNSVPKLVVTGMCYTMRESSVSFGFFQNVTMTCSMMNGQVLVRASHFDGTSSRGVGFDGREFKPIDDSSGSGIFTALPFSLTSADESRIWCTTAKLKMKVGVVSVHTEGRLQLSQSMLDLEMAVYNVV